VIQWPASSSSTRAAAAPVSGYENDNKRKGNGEGCKSTDVRSPKSLLCVVRCHQWLLVAELNAYSTGRVRLDTQRTKSITCWRSLRASRVYRQYLIAFLLPHGAPDPRAPPCIRQRPLSATAEAILNIRDISLRASNPSARIQFSALSGGPKELQYPWPVNFGRSEANPSRMV